MTFNALTTVVVALLLAVSTARAADLVNAVKAGDLTRTRALLRQKADVNQAEADGTTALHWAVHRDDLAAIDLLLGAGVAVNGANRYGVTPLSLAATNG